MSVRTLSALLLGAAAAFVTLGVMGSLAGLTDAAIAGRTFVLVPLLCALPFAIVGALAGPRAADAAGPGGAIAVGVVAMVAAVAVLAGAALAWTIVGDLTAGQPGLGSFDREHLPVLVAAVLAMGAACSPIGGLCGYAVWRRLGNGSLR